MLKLATHYSTQILKEFFQLNGVLSLTEKHDFIQSVEALSELNVMLSFPSAVTIVAPTPYPSMLSFGFDRMTSAHATGNEQVEYLMSVLRGSPGM